MVISSGIGAWVGAGVVSRMPRRGIQVFMGVALLIARETLTAEEFAPLRPVAAQAKAAE